MCHDRRLLEKPLGWMHNNCVCKLPIPSDLNLWVEQNYKEDQVHVSCTIGVSNKKTTWKVSCCDLVCWFSQVLIWDRPLFCHLWMLFWQAKWWDTWLHVMENCHVNVMAFRNEADFLYHCFKKKLAVVLGFHFSPSTTQKVPTSLSLTIAAHTITPPPPCCTLTQLVLCVH